jgi:hypothetical protein
MKLLYNTETNQRLPYTRLDNEPIDGLEPPLVTLTRVDTEPPEYDAETQQLTSEYVVDLDTFEDKQVWSVVDLPEPELVPNWPGFNFWLFTNQSFVAYGLAANSVNPYLVPAIIERYGRVAKEGLAESGFAGYWNNFCGALQVSQEHRDEWAGKAVEFGLPSDFVDVVRDS